MFVVGLGLGEFVDLWLRIIEESIKIQNWLHFDEFFMLFGRKKYVGF